MSTRRWFLGFLLGAGLVAFGATAPPAQADSCAQRIQRQEWNLQRDINRFGYGSWQVQNDRNNLDRLRYQCGYGYNNGGYNNNGGFWGPNGMLRRGDGDNDRDDRQWRNRNRDWDHDRGQNRGWDKDRGRDRGQNRGWNQDRGHDKDRGHDRDRDRDRNRH